MLLTMHLKAALAQLFMLAWVLPSFAHSSPVVEIHTDRPHGPNNRGAWRDGFDIYSDYTNNSVVPPGKLVEVRPMLTNEQRTRI